MSTEFAIPRALRVADRRRCTGETRRMVVDQLRAEGGPLIPAVRNNDQLQLEAAILFKLSEQRARPRHEHRCLLPVISRLRLGENRMALELDDGALSTFLAAVLPYLSKSGGTGIPCLRPFLARAHVDLRLLGPSGQARAAVRLLGVTKHRWREAILSAESGTSLGYRMWEYFRHRPHDRELETEGIPWPMARLASAVLRRGHLWRAATSMRLVLHLDSFHLGWSGGPSAEYVFQMFAASACGMAGISGTYQPLPDRQPAVMLWSDDSDPDRIDSYRAVGTLVEAGFEFQAISPEMRKRFSLDEPLVGDRP